MNFVACCQSAPTLSHASIETVILIWLRDFGPNNEHEMAIATVVDSIDDPSPTSIADVISLSTSRCPIRQRVLVNYIRWRMDHPIVK